MSGTDNIQHVDESPVTLLAPRPVKARRHQKSIISLDNFFTGGVGESPIGGLTASNLVPGNWYYQNPESSLAPRPSATSPTTENYSDVIPFPSLSPQHEGTIERPNRQFRSPRTSVSFHQANSLTGQMLSKGSQHTRAKSIGGSGTRSRKSSLLESWEVQNIRLSGNKMIGETEVAVFMPSAESTDANSMGYPTCQSDHNRNSASLDSQFHPMPLYSPTPDAVDELFQIMKHTTLSGTPSSSQMPLSPMKVDSNPASSHFQYYGTGNFEPPSPVSRNTRNPIILNTAFQDNHR